MAAGPTYFDLTSSVSGKATLPGLPGGPALQVGAQFKPALSLAKGERGAVIAPSYSIEPPEKGDGLHLKNVQAISGDVIRSALLFADKIDAPDNNWITTPVVGLDHLTAPGLGARTRVVFPTNPNTHAFSEHIWLVLKSLNASYPGRWSMWQGEGQSFIPEKELTPDLAFQVELNNALIIPDANTPFEDVLEFKRRHQDELLSLRHHLEGFAIKLSQEGDCRAVNVELERFDAALSDYLKKARRSNVRKAITSLTAEMDWATAVRDSLLGGGGAGLLSASGGLSLSSSATAIGLGVTAALSVKSAAGLKKAAPSPFRYIARVEREFGG